MKRLSFVGIVGLAVGLSLQASNESDKDAKSSTAVKKVAHKQCHGAVARLAGEIKTGASNYVDVWAHWQGKELMFKFNKPVESVPFAYTVAPNILTAMVHTKDRTKIIIKDENNKEIKSLVCNGPVQSVAFSKDGAFLASGQQNGIITLYDTKDFKPTECQTSGVVDSLSWTYGNLLASSGSSARVWNTQGQCLVSIEGPMSATQVVWKPDTLQSLQESRKKNSLFLGTLAVVGADKVARIYTIEDEAKAGAGPSDPKGGAGPSSK